MSESKLFKLEALKIKMENLEIFKDVVMLLLSALATVLWFNFKDVKKMAEQNEKAIADFRIETARELATHVTHQDLTNAIEALRQNLQAMSVQLNAACSDIRTDIQKMSDRFSDKLEKKADKE